jgi:hypothetical protein
MTPKKKAKELVFKFIQYTPVEYEYEYAILFALFTVDEIINTNCLIDEDVYVMTPSYIQYWQEVKQEINNL